MKYLLVLIVVVVGLWLLLRGRSAPPAGPAPGGRTQKRAAKPAPDAIVACVHCGLHLPGAEAVAGADGQPYCSDAHRLAGPAR